MKSIKIRNGIAEVLDDGKVHVQLAFGLALDEECTHDTMEQAVRFAQQQERDYLALAAEPIIPLPPHPPSWSPNYER